MHIGYVFVMLPHSSSTAKRYCKTNRDYEVPLGCRHRIASPHTYPRCPWVTGKGHAPGRILPCFCNSSKTTVDPCVSFNVGSFSGCLHQTPRWHENYKPCFVDSRPSPMHAKKRTESDEEVRVCGARNRLRLETSRILGYFGVCCACTLCATSGVDKSGAACLAAVEARIRG